MTGKICNVLFLCTGSSARSHPATAHRGFEDPAAVEGSNDEKRAAFEKIFRQIRARMSTFVSLPLHALEKNAIQQEIKKIGETPV